MAEYDIVIRNGTIVDGSGGKPYPGDVAMAGGLIKEVGKVTGKGAREIDAAGRIVTPGFVDIHTHYDGQVTWENRMVPSSDHGVTTVVMGNCGVGFAPCKPDEHEMLVKVMEGVEDIPEIVITEGVPWKWQTYPEYLDFLSSRTFDVDCASYLPHSALRIFVMGKRGAAGEPSTDADRAKMTELVTEAIKAGAVGVASSRTLFHRDSDGNLAPHVLSGRLELLALAQGLRNAGRGIFQVSGGLTSRQLKDFVPGADDLTVEEHTKREVALMREIAEVSGRPLSFTLTDTNDTPQLYKPVLDMLQEAGKDGVVMTAQTFPRPVGILYGLDLSLHPFRLHPSYLAMEHLPLAERVKRMRTPEMRAKLLSETIDGNFPNPLKKFLVARGVESYVFGNEPNYDPPPELSLKTIAEKRGVSVWEAAYDVLLERDGTSILFLPLNNFVGGNLDNLYDMLKHPNCLVGLGDGGAHYGLVCDASFPTFVLTYWTRDRNNGPRIDLPEAVKALTHRNAEAVGLGDRGLIAPGLRADLNVIDYQALKLHAPEIVHNLPAGGHRLVQRATGYVATIVNGEITYQNGVATGALPGRVVRPGVQDEVKHAAE